MAASKITQTQELQIELSDATGEYRRILRLENPDTETYTTVAEVEEAIGNVLFPSTDSAGTTKTGFFVDDNNTSAVLTKIASVTYVETTKEVQQLD